MKLHRIYAIILRYLFLFRRSYDRLSEVFYWPTIDLLIWGLTSIYFRNLSQDNSIVFVIISGIAFWIIVYRSQYEIPISLLEDLWNKNLINIFVSPLKFSEWVVAFLIMGLIKGMASFLFAVLLALLLYKVQLFSYGFYLIPFVISLMLTGWWLGFFISGLIMRYGTRVQAFAWTLVMVLAPFSAIYYPLSILPGWAQKVAFFVPTSHIFEGMRQVVYEGSLDMSRVYISLALNAVYLVLALWYMRRGFDKVLQKGLVKLY